jgi:hypothetical protein
VVSIPITDYQKPITKKRKEVFPKMTRKFFTMILAAGMLLVAIQGSTQVPKLINYQGYLTDANGKPVQDGTYTITFRIYDSQTGGTALWEETQQVYVDDGMFHVLLGSIKPVKSSIFSEANRWLGIKVGEDNEIAPRSRLVSVPYAMSADSLGGGKVVVDDRGNVGIGTREPETTLHIKSSDGLRLQSSGTIDTGKNISFVNSDGTIKSYFGRGYDYQTWTGIGASGWRFVVTDSGNVGIGTTSPSHKLKISGLGGGGRRR